ncbi:MAG: hypothetical protein R2741_03420 [Methanolobus sp.]
MTLNLKINSQPGYWKKTSPEHARKLAQATIVTESGSNPCPER